MISVEELPRFPTSVDEVIEEKDDQGHRFEDVAVRAQSAGPGKASCSAPHAARPRRTDDLWTLLSVKVSICSWWVTWAIRRCTTA